MPDSDTMGWKLLDAVSTPNPESFARCLTTLLCFSVAANADIYFCVAAQTATQAIV